MRVKLDENIPFRAKDDIIRLGHDADTVEDEHLSGADDPTVWEAAQRDNRFFVTQDLDFSDVRKFTPGTHHGLLLIRLPDSEQWRVGAWIGRWLARPDVESWARCFVVATPRKIRVLRPRKPPNELH